MTTRDDPKKTSRTPLSRERVLRAAVALADESGIDSLSMRKLGQALGVEAMSLYNHVANKEEILDGIVDIVVSQIEVPAATTDWKTAMRQRAISAHDVLLRHPWASALIESRTNPSPVRLRYCNAVIEILRDAGFSVVLAQRAFLTLDSYIYGFTLQEMGWSFDWKDSPDLMADFRSQISADEFPHVTEVMAHFIESAAGAGSEAVGYEAEFQFGLDLILDGLERVRAQ